MKLLRVLAVSLFVNLIAISGFAQTAKYPQLSKHATSKDAEIAPTGSAARSATETDAGDTTIEKMPAKLETEFALSALPVGMREQATVYLLDPKKGYQLSRRGTSGVTCLVERTAWEQADFRNDIYVPLCYDAEGSRTYLKVIIDAAALRAQGVT